MGKHRAVRKSRLNPTLVSLLLPLSVGAAFAIGLVATAPQQEATSFVARPVAPPTDTEDLPLGPTRPSQGATERPEPTEDPVEKDQAAGSLQTTSEPPTTTSVPPTQTTTSVPTRELPSVISNSVKCSDLGVAENVRIACNDIVSNVASIGTIGGIGQRTSTSCHPRGLALDLSASRVVGDAIATYALANQTRLGISYVIWKQRINFGSGWESMPDRGGVTANHFDHVHLSFLPCRD